MNTSMWHTVTVDDLGRVVTGKTPPTTQTELFGSEYPFLTPSDIEDASYHVTPERFLSQAGADKLRNQVLPPNTTCVVCIGATIGKVCLTSRPSITNQQINSVIPHSNHDAHFVYYLLRHHAKRLPSIAGGAATPIVNKSSFAALELRVPSLSIQRKIAAILSAYDDLIENNTRRIQILEEMARALYREWFVHFHFPGHEKVPMVETQRGPVPIGWGIRPLFEVAAVTYGFPFKSALFNSAGEGTPIIRIRDVRSHTSATFSTEEAATKYVVDDGDILIGMDGDFHMSRWAGGPALLNQRVVRLKPHTPLATYHLFLALEPEIARLQGSIVGTTVAHLSDKDLRSISLVVPDDSISRRASDFFKPILAQEITLRKKIRALQRTRDLLLPKLVSGDVDVSAVDVDTGNEYGPAS